MPPRVKALNDDDLWAYFTKNALPSALLEQEAAEHPDKPAQLRALLIPMRIQKGRSPKAFITLLEFLARTKKKDLVDPAQMMLIKDLIDDFRRFLVHEQDFEDFIEAWRLLGGAMTGLVQHKILDLTEAQKIFGLILTRLVSAQCIRYTAVEMEAVLEQMKTHKIKAVEGGNLYRALDHALNNSLGERGRQLRDEYSILF